MAILQDSPPFWEDYKTRFLRIYVGWFSNDKNVVYKYIYNCCGEILSLSSLFSDPARRLFHLGPTVLWGCGWANKVPQVQRYSSDLFYALTENFVSVPNKYLIKNLSTHQAAVQQSGAARRADVRSGKVRLRLHFMSYFNTRWEGRQGAWRGGGQAVKENGMTPWCSARQMEETGGNNWHLDPWRESWGD